MKITVSHHTTLYDIPSGSGIVKSGNTFYIIGDDSAYLFSLDEDFKIIERIPLLDTAIFSANRIAKADKPDFESMEMVGENELIIFGSGSKSPERNIFIRVELGDSITVEKYDISELYDNIRNLPALKNAEVNIEATAFHNDKIYLFNRKKNLIIKFEYKAILAYIRGEGSFPKPEVRHFSLPKINAIEAGFSGASVIKGESKIIFTASVENTNNAYDDGEILGSFIGLIDISGDTISDVIDYCTVPGGERRLKVESIAIDEEIDTGTIKVVLITDDDLGNSDILECVISTDSSKTY